MPGVSKDRLNVQADRNSLVIEGDAEIDMPAGMEALYADVQSTQLPAQLRPERRAGDRPDRGEPKGRPPDGAHPETRGVPSAQDRGARGLIRRPAGRECGRPGHLSTFVTLAVPQEVVGAANARIKSTVWSPVETFVLVPSAARVPGGVHPLHDAGCARAVRAEQWLDSGTRRVDRRWPRSVPTRASPRRRPNSRSWISWSPTPA